MRFLSLALSLLLSACGPELPADPDAGATFRSEAALADGGPYAQYTALWGPPTRTCVYYEDAGSVAAYIWKTDAGFYACSWAPTGAFCWTRDGEVPSDALRENCN